MPAKPGRARRRGGERDPAAPRARVAGDRRGTPATLAIFGLALALRLIHWRAGDARTGPAGDDYPGDSALWLDWASAIRRGVPFELDLPLHPPGTAHLVAALWDGSPSSVVALRILWCGLGALAVALFHFAIRRDFGPRVATISGLALAGAGSLLQLADSIDSETPYLVLVAASFLLHDRLLVAEPPRAAIALWAALQALACLFRVEHALFVALAVVAWVARGIRRGVGARTIVVAAGLAAAVALFVVAPWHLAAWRAVARLNDELPPPSAAEAAIHAAMERRSGALVWDEPARAWREALPAFARRTASAFVAATAAHRGRAAIGEREVRALDEAFALDPAAASRPLAEVGPRPLPRRFFVSLYGPLNFALANPGVADGGFSTHALERPPRLAGGATLYPPDLIVGLPPPELALAYPPHAELVVDGYAEGRRWIAEHPAAFARLVARKLAIFWSGAASGLSGHNFPVGLGGPRRAVDMAVPRPGPLSTLWQLALLAVALFGFARGFGSTYAIAAALPWLLYAASKFAVTAAFFGYARQGALVVPVVALGFALAFPAPANVPDAPPWRRALPFAAAGALLAAELVRFAQA
jgi:hypothetical protein